MKKLLSILLACGLFATALCGCGENTVVNPDFVEGTTAPVGEELTEKLFKVHGFTEDERRTELELDTSKGINTKKVKNYIYDRMLNTIDYFDSIQGTFYYVSNTGKANYTAYDIQQGSSASSKEMVFNADGQMVNGYFFNGSYVRGVDFGNPYSTAEADSVVDEAVASEAMKTLNEFDTNGISDEMVYESNDVDLENLIYGDYVKLVNSRCRIKENKDKNEPMFFARENIPQLSSAMSQYASSSIVQGFLGVFKRWDVVREEKLFDRDCFVIEGKVKGAFSTQYDTRTFEFVVDQENGILLSMKTFDGNGNQTMQLTTCEYTVK